MDRIQSINPDRLLWCCKDRGITVDELAYTVGISVVTLKDVIANELGLTFNQLKKIAVYFNRGVLFFLEPGRVNESHFRTPQFRTVANQKIDLLPEVKAMIERVEMHREIYLGLREDFDDDIAPRFEPPAIPQHEAKAAAAIAREWLGVKIKNNFQTYRDAIEAKGILVFRSMGYKGAWRIPSESSVVGLSLYHTSCPVIVVKKQETETRQVFTLMHELCHILLHRISKIDENKDLESHKGHEYEANTFAGHLLVPDDFLQQIDDAYRPSHAAGYFDWLKKNTSEWGVSTEVILRRLCDCGRLSNANYLAYRQWRNNQPVEKQSRGTRMYRAREPIHIFGKPFVQTVIDSLHTKQITMNKASSYLDNIKVKDVHALEAYLANL